MQQESVLATDRDDQQGRVQAGVLVSLCLGVVPQALASSALAVAMPSIQDEFQAGPHLAWVISSTYLATGVGAIITGRLSDLFGARRVLLCGLGVASVATVAAMLAPTLATLIAARAVAGLGTSAPLPAALALLRRARPQQDHAASSGLGVIAASMQVTIALGPPLGGLLVELGGWRSILAVTLPLMAAAAGCVYTFVPADAVAARSAGWWRTLDVPGMIVMACTTTVIMVFLLQLNNGLAWDVAAGLALQLVILVWWSRRAEQPFVRLNLAADPTLSRTFLCNAGFYLSYYAIFYGFPLYLIGKGLSPTMAGLIMLPIAASTAVTSVVAARGARRRGPGHVLLVGSVALLLSGLAIVAVISRHPIDLQAFLALGALIGVPAGCLAIGYQARTVAAAPAADVGAAAGLLRSAQYVGAVAASAVLPLLSLDAGGDASGLGWTVAGVGAALVAMRPCRPQGQGGGSS
ncbi:MFS transporter [Crossiella sp. SN42]|uniref:MFS transporter n=1 Tax=Crossiella sp. SN42 TaxID=2944808 RepID=UPI00207C6F3A|nr:MFS transporter [Crossiella sp. SN42]MCO1575577.1 MFS transporter [Crossiella sp. SN42]